MTGWYGRALLAPVLIAVSMAGVEVAAELGKPAAQVQVRPRGETRPVQGLTLVCPATPAQSSDVVTRTVIATSRPGQGNALVQSQQPVGQPPPVSLAGLPQQMVSLAQPVSQVTLSGPPLVIRATGPASGGVVATRVTRGDQGQERGFSVDTCSAPRTEAWFVGASAAPGQDAVLQLTNPDPTPAEVSISALTPTGPVTPVLTSGLVIPGNSSSDVPLDRIAPGQPDTAVHVVASRGRVSTSMREHRGLTSLKAGGVDAVPQAPSATRTVSLAGVIGSVDSTVIAGSRMHRVLTVGVPGVAEATVRITVTDDSGTFTPTGFDAVTVAPGTVKQINLDGVVTAERALVRVTSAERVPLVAGVLIDGQARYGDFHDTLHIGATAPLRGPSFFPDARVAHGQNGDTDTFVAVASPERSAVVTATAGGKSFGLEIPAGSLNEFKVHVASRGDTAVLITPAPGSPDVYVSASIEELGLNGPLLGGAAVGGGLGDVPLPPAYSEPGLPLVDSSQ